MQPAQFVVPGHLLDQDGQVSDSFSLTDCESMEVTHVSLNIAEKRYLATVYADSVADTKARLKQQSKKLSEDLDKRIELLEQRSQDVDKRLSSVVWDESLIK